MESDSLQKPCGSEVQCADLASLESAHRYHADASVPSVQEGFEAMTMLTYSSSHDLNQLEMTDLTS